MTLIKDLIDIPERVHKGDFVLRLSEGVEHADATLRDYVVTPELTRCFDDALAIIQSALQGRTSKASYLHGSFGSGKSHFMAVLHLILQGNARARSIPELAPVIARHNAWTTGRKFLLVPYHMIGAHDMESGILGGYVDFVRRAHPDAPIPAVYLAEGLFRDAANLRDQMGDDAFFGALSAGGGDDGWGDLEAGWDAARFDDAVVAPPGSEERSGLISALIGRFFGSYDTQAGGRGEAFLPLDKGLSVISRHAASLGYDALILFLDELILWLASHASNLDFVHREGQKLAKLVEAQTPDRPVPIVSFVARQRDLRELIGDTVPGADRLNFSDSLGHWEGRFHRITLEDRNLPAIAEKRVLRPRSEAARLEIDHSFEQTMRLRDSVLNTLLTSEGDRAMFRKVYPFSPALVQTLIAVSSVLQRERTALKVMIELLVDQRDTLALGDIVPVGDLFDVIAHGDEAFTQEMAIHFDNAKRLYHQKLLPLLEKQHGRREEVERLAYDDPARAAFRAEDRLLKTLLLAALVPEVETLRALTAERLAALNHGSIKTPIPGREAQDVVRRCRAWAAAVGEIRIGDESNPTISIQLSGVDTETIIEQARREDNQGNRLRRVRQMLFAGIGVEDADTLDPHRDLLWRNTRRSCAVLFRNIRDLQDTGLENSEERWTLVVDYPFDEPGHGPRDDLGRLQEFMAAHPEGARTLCWVPAFLSADALKDLGMLVLLDHVLSGERLAQYAGHLSLQDRQSAKLLLDNQHSVLEQRVQNHLDAAYGLDSLSPGSLDEKFDLDAGERYQSLLPGFAPAPPAAARLGQAADQLLGQALGHQFPAAPDFQAEIKSLHLNKVWAAVSEATQAEDGRVFVADRAVRVLLQQIANPLLLGEMRPDATHFVLGHHWRQHFTRKTAEAGGAMTVRQLRRWIDEPKAMGLPKDAQNLVVLAFAAQTNRGFYRQGTPVEPALSSLPDDCELREQHLPDAAQWETAVARAGSIFGLSISPLLKESNTAALASGVQRKAVEARAACERYRKALQDRLEGFGFSAAEADRMNTAAATVTLVERLHEAKPGDVVTIMASAEIATTDTAMGECLNQSAALAATMEGANWEIFQAIGTLADERRPEADAVRRAVEDALRSDEHALPLAAALKLQQSKALVLLTQAASPPPAGPETGPEPGPAAPHAPRPGRRVVRRDSRDELDVAGAMELLSVLDVEARTGRQVRIRMSWTVEEESREP